METSLRGVLISIVLFVGIISGCFLFVSSFLPTNTPEFQRYNATFNRLENISSRTSDMQNQMTSGYSSTGFDNILTRLISVAWGVIRTLWDSVSIMQTMLGYLATQFDVPLWFVNILVAILGIIVIFGIISLIFSRDT